MYEYYEGNSKRDIFGQILTFACPGGVIERRWFATDSSGHTTNATQTIVVGLYGLWAFVCLCVRRRDDVIFIYLFFYFVFFFFPFAPL